MKTGMIGYETKTGMVGEQQAVRSRRRPYRVLLLDFWCFIPYYMMELANGLKSQNVQAEVLASSYRFDPDFFAKHGVRNNKGFFDIVSKKQMRPARLRQVLKLFEYCCNLLLLCLKLPFSCPEIIHIQFLALLSRGVPLELLLLKVAQILGTKIVCTVHNLLPHDTGDKHRKLFGRLYAMADLIICHNQVTGERLVAEFSVAPSRVCIIPHGPLQKTESRLNSTEARKELQLPQDRCIVLWQGVIAAYKGLDFLLEAWKSVTSGAYLVIAGTGQAELLGQLRDQVAAMKSKDIRLDLLFIEPEKLPLYYSAADILVYPYKQITTSGALMTGLGYGKAMIATALPAFAEILENEKHALLVSYGDSAALAHAIDRLAVDPALRLRLETGACGVAEQYSWTAIAAKTRASYEELLHSC